MPNPVIVKIVNSRNQSPMGFVVVTIGGKSTSTGTDGIARFDDVILPGTITVRAQYISPVDKHITTSGQYTIAVTPAYAF